MADAELLRIGTERQFGDVAALEGEYLVTRGLDPEGTRQARWTMRWKPAMNAFAVTVTVADRMPTAETL